MDFVAPPLLGYAGGAGLLEYTGAGAETGHGTSHDPFMISSDEDEVNPESPRVVSPVSAASAAASATSPVSAASASATASAASVLPTAVPVIELKAIRRREDRDGIGYDRDLKMRNFSVQNSSGYIVFQNITRRIVELDGTGESTTRDDVYSEAWTFATKGVPTDSFYVMNDWLAEQSNTTMTVSAAIWIEKNAGSLAAMGFGVRERIWRGAI